MAVTDRKGGGAPAALTWLWFAGLALILLGERVLTSERTTSLALDGAGALAVLGATLWRALAWSRAEGGRRGIEALIALGYGGGALALLGYAAGTSEMIDALGLEFADVQARDRYQGALTALWPILLACAALPVVFGELSYASMRRAQVPEARRVRASAAAGLTLAMAAAYLLLLGFVASERDVKADFSYFKTSRPSESTRNVVASLGDRLKLLLFFPDVNDVRDEVLDYARELARATGKVDVEVHDRLGAPKLAEEYRVTKDGTLVIARGDKKEQLAIGAELDAARGKLRTLDREVQKLLLRIARERRTVYLTAGHGELNDPPKGEAEKARERAPATGFKQLLEQMNFTVKTLSLSGGLAGDVPDDAAAVFALGPTEALLPEEMDTLARYLKRGGRLLFALDPESGAGLGPLADLLGVSYDRTPLANERVHLRRRFNESDRTLLATNRFSSHASVTTLSRHSQELATVFLGTGSFAKPESAAPPGGAVPKVDFVIRAMPDTFADANGNFARDGDAEKTTTYNLAAAISRKLDDAERAQAQARKPAGDGEQGAKAEELELRALLLGDADALSDAVLGNLANLYLAADAVRWLAGEEKLGGEPPTTEEDVRIEHTREQDAKWFYGTTLGIPLLVLGGGLGYTRGLRRRKVRP